MNALLQAPCFDAQELASIAAILDARESALHGGGSGGGNVSDAGDFSVDVLREALKLRGVELSGDKAEVEAALKAPGTVAGYLLNMREHWFAVRRVGGTWCVAVVWG